MNPRLGKPTGKPSSRLMGESDQIAIPYVMVMVLHEL